MMSRDEQYRATPHRQSSIESTRHMHTYIAQHTGIIHPGTSNEPDKFNVHTEVTRDNYTAKAKLTANKNGQL